MRGKVVNHQWIHVFLPSKAREEKVLARHRVASTEIPVSKAFLYMQLSDVRASKLAICRNPRGQSFSVNAA